MSYKTVLLCFYTKPKEVFIMKKRSLIKSSFILVGLLAIAMTGCGKVPAENVVQVLAAEKIEMTQPDNSTQEDAITQLETAPQSEPAADSHSNTKQGEMTSMAGGTIEEPELVQAVTDALAEYFDITYDPAAYKTNVTYFEGFNDLKPSYSVKIDWPGNWEIIVERENIGSDGFPTAEALKNLKPEFFATFSETKELTGLYVSYMGWEKAEKQLSLEEVKAVAKEFLVSNEMIVDGRIEFMGSTIISENRTIVTYQNGENGAIDVSVDTAAGKVDHFEYMSKERAEMILKPKSESELLG